MRPNNCTINVEIVLLQVLKYYSTILASVHSGDSQLENLDRRLLLPEWMRMCSIPLSIIAQRVFMLRMLLRLRVACSAKLHAIHGSMPLANFEVINDELDVSFPRTAPIAGKSKSLNLNAFRSYAYPREFNCSY
uniref:Uncharacterized protein n=1 Tax=Parascaris equorum TaxID=6256 RepID=A0A914R3Z2_PAREQ